MSFMRHETLQRSWGSLFQVDKVCVTTQGENHGSCVRIASTQDGWVGQSAEMRLKQKRQT